MSIICDSGNLLMHVKDCCEENLTLEEYPFEIPKVYLAAHTEDYDAPDYTGWGKDSVVIVRDQHIVEYSRTSMYYPLGETRNGNVLWTRVNPTLFKESMDRHVAEEFWCAPVYAVVEYDLDSLVKRTYKVVENAVSDLDAQDVDRIMVLYGEEEFCRDFTIRDRKVYHRVRNYEDTFLF